MILSTHGPQFANDSESLQADVMRFMAIIAFCLVAILALVRNAEPPQEAAPSQDPLKVEPLTTIEPVVQPPEPAVQVPPIEAIDEPTDPPEESEFVNAIAAVPPEPPKQPEQTDRSPEPKAAPEPVFEMPEPAPAAPAELAEAISPPTSAPTSEAPAAPADPKAEEEGLTLRFASDRDFLRLIARGDIRVYAYAENDVLGLDGSYRFLDSPAPGEVYELLTTSIPDLVVDALRKERTDIGAFRWGIALPSRISNQIEEYLEEVEHGQLIIDRYGDVHHVAAS